MNAQTTPPFRIPELETPFVFANRPVDVPGDLRPLWRIGLIVLLLKNCCRQQRARFTQLHVLNWASLAEDNRTLLERAIAGHISSDEIIVRFEPSLNRAVDLAIGEGLVQRLAGDQIELTAEGTALADLLLGQNTTYVEEKAFMRRIKKQVTGSFVDSLFR